MASKPPYPGYAPSYRNVKKTGGYTRTCLVIELLSLGDLDNVQMAFIQEQLEATVEKMRQKVMTLESTQVVTPDRFDPLLQEGLRIV